MRTFIAATAALLYVCSCVFAQSPTVLVVAPEFKTPVKLPSPVNLSGWQDSPQILPSGSKLYFTYFRIDPMLQQMTGQIRISETRPGWPAAPAYAIYGAELYAGSFVNGAWQPPQSLGSVINLPEDAEGDLWISQDEQRILFTNGTGSPTRPRGIYYSQKVAGAWTKPVLASSMGFPFLPTDENPHLTLDESTLFFESSRSGGFGGKDLWMSKKVNGTWQTPVNLGSRVNTGGTEGSPFSFDGSIVYFDDKGSGGGIFRVRRGTDGTYGSRELVLAGYAGDPSLDLQGNLYFVQGTAVYTSGSLVGYSSNIMVAPTKGL